jgi:hypothetical protein
MKTAWLSEKTDRKNEHHRLTKLQIQGYTDSGIVVQGDRSLAHVFTRCVVQGRDKGQFGISGRASIRSRRTLREVNGL